MWPKKPKFEQPRIEDVLKTATILVIDDQDWPYETNLRAEGYHIERKPDVKTLGELTQQHYNLILLDVAGVGKLLGQGSNGITILAHIKSESPTQPVVLYSSKSLGMRSVPDAHLADAILDKSDPFTKFKETIDRLLIAQASPGHYLAAINARLGAQVVDVPELAPEFLAAVRRRDIEKLGRYLSERLVDRALVGELLAIASVAITLASN